MQPRSFLNNFYMWKNISLLRKPGCDIIIIMRKSFFLLLSGFVFPYAYVFGQGVGGGQVGGVQQKLIGIVNKIADFLGTVFLIVATIMFLYSGYVYWQAGGKPDAIAKAHQNLLWAVIGTAVGLLAFAAPGIIAGFLG